MVEAGEDGGGCSLVHERGEPDGLGDDGGGGVVGH